ncbi:unannotated protein [freshwater metagenome]|uniref:Unannotated protein n=1 Tax=freshwater metagenome TaxID=449393 RepID=A0A6J6YCB4_9ZZZZ|nr:endolytic transglycosylase MltG [Actinomycetota bacterium]
MRSLIKPIAISIILTGLFVNLHNAFFLIDYRAKENIEKIDVVINSGDTGLEISRKLFEQGVVKTSKAFYRVALNEKRSTGISPGVHNLDRKISAHAALDQLLDKSNLLEGKASGLILPNKKYGTTNIEGFLFPAQYAFAPQTTVDEAISQMIERFEISATNSKLSEGYGDYSAYQTLIIASIAQAEGDKQDYAKIARVIYNRLNIDMPLQMNTTVEYAAKLRGQIRMSYKQLEINSKYNTYLNRGLPPSPIGSPGEDAMRAAVNPENGDWLYFITVKPQDTRFTNSFSQFNIWANEFRANEKAGLFK